jgi:D-xylose 1-dehydrogenase (NADP+, D-xylono-1,5-lactone-forming)
MSELRWGIIGPGRIAPRIVRALSQSERGELVAVASRDPARAKAFADRFGVEQSFGSYEAFLEASDVDVVYVSLPNHLHAAWTIRALEAGKHVLCEKPLALRVEEVDAVIAASQRAGRVAAEGFMYLHHPQTIRAMELAHTGALGQLQLVNGSFSFFLTYPNDPRVEPTMGGGSLWDVGCYPVSFSRSIAGQEPESLSAYARFDDQGVDRTFIGQLQFASGLLAQFDSGFAAQDRERMEIVGSDATLVLDAPFLPEPDGPPPSVTMWRGRAPSPVEVPSVDQYHSEVEDLMSVILGGGEPRLTLASSRGNVATLVALDRAARAGDTHHAPDA